MLKIFKTLSEARTYLKDKYPSLTFFSRQEASEALRISTATLHRLRGKGMIKPTVTITNGHSHITYKRDEVAMLLFKRGIEV